QTRREDAKFKAKDSFLSYMGQKTVILPASDQDRAVKADRAPVALRIAIISRRSARLFQNQSGPSPGRRCIELRHQDHNGLVPGLRGRIESAAPVRPARWLRKSEQTDVDPTWRARGRRRRPADSARAPPEPMRPARAL